MEKKYKISDFATLLGITAKTVYRMVDREEVKTCQEKVNNRLTTMVIATNDQIEQFKIDYGKYTGYVGKCEDILIDNNEGVTSFNDSQMNNNSISANEILEKIVSINEEYNNRIQSLNEELIESKSKLLMLEDKAGREGMYLNEINTLKRDNKELMRSKQNIFNLSLIVISALLLVIISMFMFNVVSKDSDIDTTEKSVTAVSKMETTAPVKAESKAKK